MILGFLLTALYWPGIAGAATTPRWALLAVALPVVLLFMNRGGAESRSAGDVTSLNPSSKLRDRPRALAGLASGPRITLIHLIGVLYLTWSAISLSWTPNGLDGIGELIKLAILAQAFVLGSHLSNLRPFLMGLAAGLLASSCLVLLQLAYPDLVLHTTTHSGLFINSGSLAEISALVIIGLLHGATWNWRNASLWLAICLLPCVVLPQSRGLSKPPAGAGRDLARVRLLNVGATTTRKLCSPFPRFDSGRLLLIPALLPCVILPQSRGAWLALIASFTVLLWSKSKLSALALMALAVISFTYSLHINFHISSVVQRWGMWTDAASGLTLLGHGIGSFWTDYAPLSNTLDIFLERPEHLHNDWLEIIFEGGLPGLVVVGVLSLLIARRAGAIEGVILAGFAAEAAVGFPIHVPCTAFLAALCLGHASRNGITVRDLLYTGRAKLRQLRHGSGTHWTPEGQRPLVSA